MKRTISTFLVTVGLGSGLAAAPAWADVILLGSDYLHTVSASVDLGGGPIALVGDPFGPGNTDVIVQRQANAVGPSDTIPIEIVALQLRTAAPIDLGNGLHFYYAVESTTLQSTGQMAINGIDGGARTFSNSFTLFYDLKEDSPNNPLTFFQNSANFSSTGNWDFTGPCLVIDPPAAAQDANCHPQAIQRDPRAHDFFIVGQVVHTAPGHEHIADSAVPEPASLALLALGLAGLGFARRRVT